MRQLISIPAGLSRMNLGVFCLFTFLGALLWNVILAILGWQLSVHVAPQDLFDAVERYNRYLTWGGLALLVICIAFILFKAFSHKNNKPEQSI